MIDATVIENPYIPHEPEPKQSTYLALPEREALYGGAAGGGKSDALLMAALQYVEVAGYAALLLRRTFQDLALPGALIPRSHEWLGGTDARWDEKRKEWTFPSGATLTFGYLATERDKYQYQGAAFQFIGWDELTQFLRSQYTYVFSRLRRLEGSKIPLRCRAATNPGGPGHEWVKDRFINPGRPDRPFIPALLADNPHLDQDDYMLSLIELDPLTRQHLLDGNWDAMDEGAMFRRSWFPVVDSYPVQSKRARHWDPAATEPAKGRDPDYTAGALLAEHDGIIYVIDIKRDRQTPLDTERLIKQTAQIDGTTVHIGMEEEGGASGKNMIDHYRREVLMGFSFSGVRATGSKTTRAAPWASAAQAGNVRLVRGPWIEAFLDEVSIFPLGGHDDQVDAVSGAFAYLTAGYVHPSTGKSLDDRLQALDTQIYDMTHDPSLTVEQRRELQNMMEADYERSTTSAVV